MDSGHHTVPLAGVHDYGQGLIEGLFSIVVAWAKSEVHGEVRRSHIDDVDAGDREDLVEGLEGRCRLDHGDALDEGLRLGHIVASVDERCPCRPSAPEADRWVSAGPDGGFRLGGRVDQWNDHAGGAGIQAPSDGRRVVGAHPDECPLCMWVGRLEQRKQVVPVDKAMLHVDAEVVESEKRSRFRRNGGRELQPASELTRTAVQRCRRHLSTLQG